MLTTSVRTSGGIRTLAAALIVAAATLTAAPHARAGAASGQSPAAQPTPIPDVPIATRGGAAVNTATALPAQGRWLLVHVQRGCGPCDALLGRIQGEAFATIAPRLVIVVAGANAADVEKMAATYPALDRATWYADETGALAAALQIQEAPVVVAVADRGIQWTLAGVLSGSKRLQDVLTAWARPRR